MGQRMSSGCFLKWLSGPALASLQAAVEFAETSDQLSLLLLEHLDVSDFVLVWAMGWEVKQALLLFFGGKNKRTATYPLGYTLSCDFLRSPKTQIALSALQRLQGLAPSH